jgi:hypothetical protein
VKIPAAAGIFLIACAAVAIHGYHLGADDAAIYVPAIKKVADPALYPFGQQFFESHARLTAFPILVGGTARLTHLPVDLTMLLWHLAGVFLLLLATWQLGAETFASTRARWGGVALIAGLLTVPAAGTGLVLMDPYLTSRTLSTPAAMFAIAAYLGGRWKTALLWLVFTAAIHLQMSVYVIALVGLMEAMKRLPRFGAVAFGLLPASLNFDPPQGPAREALLDRTFFFVNTWAWYEWLGAIAPLAILAWLAKSKLRATRPAFQRISAALCVFGLLAIAGGLLVIASPRLINFTRLQPMRAFHPLYCIFFALLGGLLGEYVLGNKALRWAALFVPIAMGMYFAQAGAYPYSAHIEWPGLHDGNSWSNAFYWIRDNTPKDAVFALDPNYMGFDGEDQHGFRAVAERSVLADQRKDSGAVSLFPWLGDEWKREELAQTGLDHFAPQDYQRLEREYPVTWIVTRAPGPGFEDCLYRNKDVAVCRLRP